VVPGARTTVGRFAKYCGVELEPFQRRITAAAAGPERELAVLIPRGNGKTMLSALIALHHLVTVESAQVYCAAASREQARILFEYAERFARALGHPNVVHRHHELRWCPDPADPKAFDRHLRVLAADAPLLHGLTYSLCVLDEFQAHKWEGVYDALATALRKRTGAKLVMPTTAGVGAGSPLGRLRARALAQPSVQRKGAFTDARGPYLRMLEWSVPDGANLDKPRVVKRANPLSTITIEDIAADRAGLSDTAFERFTCNRWVEAERYWLPPGAWAACAADYEIEPSEDVWLGVDIGGERSASAVVWATEDLRVGVDVFQGAEAVLRVRDRVRELAHRFTVRRVVFDPMRFEQAAMELQQERVRVEAFPQTHARMVPASERLYAAVIEQRLNHPNDPELNRHVAATVAKQTERGWRVAKLDSRDQIDAVVAMAMAVEAAETAPRGPVLHGWL
jgi:phage terminase large subunit-like protein